MSKFKVTLRKNGSAVGEMHYGSEAVAVTKAKAMKDATGCDVTVAPAKANRRRAATRRRNGMGLRRSPVGSAAQLKRLSDLRFALEHAMQEVKAAEAMGGGTDEGLARLNRLLSSWTKARGDSFDPTYQQAWEVKRQLEAKVNPRRRAATRRRNGTGLSRASMHSRARAGSLAKMGARIKAMGLDFADFGKPGSALYPVWDDYRVAQHWAEQMSRASSPSSVAEARVAFQQFVEAERVLLDAVGATRRRNPESTTLWTVRVGSQEIGEFHAPSHLTAAIAREAAKVAAEQGYTAAYFKRWGSVSDGMHRHPVAAFLKNGHRCNPSCGCPKSNRRRRNGTTAGEAAASRSLAHRAAMLLTR